MVAFGAGGLLCLLLWWLEDYSEGSDRSLGYKKLSFRERGGRWS